MNIYQSPGCPFDEESTMRPVVKTESMKGIHIHIHHHAAPCGHNDGILTSILSSLNSIKMGQTQLAADLVALKEQADKAKAEIIAKFQSLEDAITAAGDQLSPAVNDALAALKTSIQGVDDIVPDAVVTDAAPAVDTAPAADAPMV